jgi:hypothetical protein
LNPSLPIIPRDYYLSKIFQFLSLSVDAALDESGTGREDRWVERHIAINTALSDVDDTLLPHLPFFDWFTFQRDVWQSVKSDPSLKDLYSCLSDPDRLPGAYFRTERIVHPAAVRIARRDRREPLLSAYRAVTSRPYAYVYHKQQVDEREFRRWQTGELPDTSSVSEKLEAGFREAIQEAEQGR